MEIVKDFTGAAKSAAYKVEKPIATVIITKDGDFSSWANEELKAYIESSDGQNIDLIKAGIKIVPLFMLSQLGEGAGSDVAGTSSQIFVKLSGAGNALELTNNQKIMLELNGLDAAKKYTLDGYELPVTAKQCLEYERKLIQQGDTTKELDVTNFNGIVIENRDKITKLEVTYINGKTCKYGPREVQHMLNQINDLAVTSATGANMVFGAGNYIALGLANASQVHIETDGTETEVILSKIKNY